MIEDWVHAKPTEAFLDAAAEWARRYFRIEIEGLENVPKTGPVLIAANHSGWAGADALMLSHILHRELGRAPKILAHRAFFHWVDALSRLSHAFGLEEATIDGGRRLLSKGEAVVIFPEGEAGNFKSSKDRYRLRPFHTGAARMSRLARAPIVPCLVLGAEESHLNIGSFRLPGKKLRLPLPLNLLPLPARWKIRFLKPIGGRLRPGVSAEKLTHTLERVVQAGLKRELRRRPYVYFSLASDPGVLALSD